MGIIAVSREPDTKKYVSKGNSEELSYAVCEMQGWRPYMEDANFVEMNSEEKVFGIFDGHGGYQVSKFVAKYFYRVFIATKAYKNGNFDQALVDTFLLMDEILKMPNINKILISLNSMLTLNKEFDFEFLKLQMITKESNKKFVPISIFYDNGVNRSYVDLKPKPVKHHTSPISETSTDYIEEPSEKIKENEPLASLVIEEEIGASELEKNFDSVDKDSEEPACDDIYSFGGVLVDQSNQINEGLVSYAMGTTANVVMIKDRTCYIANVGDSMAVLFKNGKAVRLNLEHKLNLKKETERIIKSGTEIFNNRIAGRLNLTRAIGKIFNKILGDHMFKNKPHLKNYQQAVTALPEINKFQITKDMEFIVMGCDGIWDCVDVQDMCEYISQKIKEKFPLTTILKQIFGQFISKHPDCKINFNS